MSSCCLSTFELTTHVVTRSSKTEKSTENIQIHQSGPRKLDAAFEVFTSFLFKIGNNAGKENSHGQNSVEMIKKNKILVCLMLCLGCAFALLFFCEYLIYFIIISQCSWPELREGNADSSVAVEAENREAVKALFLADVHLLGMAKGHWLDKLRREWQMQRAFQTAISLFQPEVVFILGDLFDKGLDSSEVELQYYLKRLSLVFEVKKNTKIYLVAGNHDVGFHYDVSEGFLKKFVKALGVPSVQLVSIRGNHFVLINSMAMAGDGCFLCRPAQKELNRIAKQLRCARGFGKCPPFGQIKQYSRPILLQHFPMYRESDRSCLQSGEAPHYKQRMEFYEGRDCLSKEASQMIYDFLEPRLILDGHTHQDCHVVHRKDIHEYTLTSFNWRNENNPSFLMGMFLPNNFAIRKCHIPRESTVIFLYCMGFFGMTIYVMITIRSSKTRVGIKWKLE